MTVRLVACSLIVALAGSLTSTPREERSSTGTDLRSRDRCRSRVQADGFPKSPSTPLVAG